MTEAAIESTPPSAKPAEWRTNLVLFLATVASVFFTGVATQGGGTGGYLAREPLVRGGQFAATILVILVAHEMGE